LSHFAQHLLQESRRAFVENNLLLIEYVLDSVTSAIADPKDYLPR